jgi:hypothetical protein
MDFRSNQELQDYHRYLLSQYEKTKGILMREQERKEKQGI